MRTSILNTATTEQMGCIRFFFFRLYKIYKLVFIVSLILVPVAYPMHDGLYAAAYETYEKEVSPDTLHKSLTLPDSHARNDVRSGNQGSRGSWSESQPFPSLRGLAVRHRLRSRQGRP